MNALLGCSANHTPCTINSTWYNIHHTAKATYMATFLYSRPKGYFDDDTLLIAPYNTTYSHKPRTSNNILACTSAGWLIKRCTLGSTCSISRSSERRKHRCLLPSSLCRKHHCCIYLRKLACASYRTE